MNLNELLGKATPYLGIVLQVFAAIQALEAGVSVPITTYIAGKKVQITLQEVQ